MLRLLLFMGCFLSLHAQAVSLQGSGRLESHEIKNEHLLHEGLPFVAVRTREANITIISQEFKKESKEYYLGRAQKRADQICQSMNYLYASPLSLENLLQVESVEGWLLGSTGSVELINEERKVSQLSWLSMLSGSFAYRYPMVFKSISCRSN